jgi:hypothetical protein
MKCFLAFVVRTGSSDISLAGDYGFLCEVREDG